MASGGFMRTHFIRALIFGATLCAAPAVQAHHGTSITYFVDKSITVSGVITEFVYGYPHPQVYFDVKKEDGKVEKWGSEFGPTPLMMRNMKVGWSRDSIKPGDSN